MPSNGLEKAQTQLIAAKQDLLSVERKLRLKGPQNIFLRSGYSKYTTFASSALLRLFNRGSTPNSSSFLEELWFINGFRGDYESASRVLLQEVKKAIQQPMSSDYNFFVEKTLAISPEEFLLMQISSKMRGESDENMLFCREHYRFPDDRTMISHFILTFPFQLLLTPRDFLVVSTFEKQDGVIWYNSRSVKGLLSESKGCVRGIIRNFGFRCEGTEEGCRLKFIFDFDPAIWLPRLSFKEIVQESLNNFLHSCEALALQLRGTVRLKQLKKTLLPELPEIKLESGYLERLKREQEELDRELELLDTDSEGEEKRVRFDSTSSLSSSSISELSLSVDSTSSSYSEFSLD